MKTKHFKCARVYAADVPSSTNEDVVYRVSLVGAKPHCTCPGFHYNEKCKHAAMILEVACMWDSQTNPRGCAHPVDGMCPMCGWGVTSYEFD